MLFRSFNYINKAHDHNQDHIMGERDNHIATRTSLSPDEGLLPPHRRKQRCRWSWLPEVDHRLDRVPKQEQSDPRNLSAMAGKLCCVSEKILRGLGFCHRDLIYSCRRPPRRAPQGRGGLWPPLARLGPLESPFWLRSSFPQ